MNSINALRDAPIVVFPVEKTQTCTARATLCWNETVPEQHARLNVRSDQHTVVKHALTVDYREASWDGGPSCQSAASEQGWTARLDHVKG
jgi:hypothetical protein